VAGERLLDDFEDFTPGEAMTDGKQWRTSEPGEMIWWQILGERIQLAGDI
jgi:hypothetical protein